MIQLDERYNLVSGRRLRTASRPISCNGDNGWLTQPDTLTPVGSLTNPRATATNPDYLTKGMLVHAAAQHPARRALPVVGTTA